MKIDHTRGNQSSTQLKNYITQTLFSNITDNFLTEKKVKNKIRPKNYLYNLTQMK